MARALAGLLQQVHRLFNLGAVGGMTDAQLLNTFVSQRDQAAEAAFEELMIRHGPMVLRICRSVLRDAHDAEDAFQATFLVARGVLSSMLLNQLEVVMVFVVLCIGGSFPVWHAVAAAINKEVQASPNKVIGTINASERVSVPKARPNPPGGTYRLSGAVRVDGTGEPAAGTKLQIHAGDAYDLFVSTPTFVETGADGLFAVDLPAGPVQVRLTEPPVGYYWSSGTREFVQSFYLGPDEPAISREYRVRKGVVWNIEFTRGTDRRPVSGSVSWNASDSMESFEGKPLTRVGCP